MLTEAKLIVRHVRVCSLVHHPALIHKFLANFFCFVQSDRKVLDLFTDQIHQLDRKLADPAFECLNSLQPPVPLLWGDVRCRNDRTCGRDKEQGEYLTMSRSGRIGELEAAYAMLEAVPKSSEAVFLCEH